VPLLILAAMQIRHYYLATRGMSFPVVIGQIISGHSTFSNVAAFCGWIVFLLVLIYLTGHYVGIATFMYILLSYIAREKTGLSVSISLGVTLFIYVLFEHVLGMELFRGMIYRLSAGYGF